MEHTYVEYTIWYMKFRFNCAPCIFICQLWQPYLYTLKILEESQVPFCLWGFPLLVFAVLEIKIKNIKIAVNSLKDNNSF